MRRITGLTTMLLLVLTGTVGCIRLHGPGDLKRELSEQAGVELDKEFGITVTRSGLWLARQAMKIAEDEDEIPSLKGLRKVQVGVYTVEGLRPDVEEAVPVHLAVPDGWERLARVHEPGEDVIVAVRIDEDGEIRRMLVVVAEEDEWVLVKLKGRLSTFLENAMEFAFDEADRPELFARVNEEYRKTLEDDPPADLS